MPNVLGGGPVLVEPVLVLAPIERPVELEVASVAPATGPGGGTQAIAPSTPSQHPRML
jgi:hypothetical protein